MHTAIVVIASALALMFQAPASIQGVLTDASGAVIPGAAVSLSGAKVERVVQTNADGSYAFTGIPAGDYVVKVAFPGLEPFEKRVAVATGKSMEVAIELRLQALTQSVNVTGEPEAELSLDSTDSASAVSMQKSDLDALPDNPDDLLNILQALAGPSGGSSGGQILIDGFTGGQLPPKSAIKEIRINQDPFSAAYDSMGFGRIEIVTKPGTDTFHGGFGMGDSDVAFNSRNPYAANKADYVNRMWGLNVGGAIRNRASYALTFDRNTINNTALIKAVTLDPTTLVESPVAKTVVVPRSDTSGSARLDHQITTNNSVTAGYRHWTSHQENNGIGQYSLESRGYSSESSTTEVRFTETAVLSSRTVTETRFGLTRNSNHRYGDTATPSLIVSNAFNGGSAQTGRTFNVKTLTEIQNNTTVVHGVHSIRFGGRLRYIPITDISPSNFGGTFSFFGVPDAQITSLEQYRRTLLFQSLGYDPARIRSLGGGASQFSITAGNPQVKFSQTEVGVYILDDWRARPNLTVNVGLRYENQTNIHDWRDFAPRISLAWSPATTTGVAPKTVFRVGWGAFYQRFDFNPTQQALRFNGVTEKQYIVSNPDFYPNVPATTSLPAQESLTTYRLDPHLRTTPWMYTALSIERQLPANTNISVIYRDQRTTHILQTVNINAPLPGGVRPFGDAAGNIFQFQSGAIQKAKWLTAQVNSKLNPRVSLTLQYTFMDAHNHGGYTDGGRWELATPSNPYNLNADWARAGWANKHSLNLLGTLPGPLGLQLNPLFIVSSGRPYDLTIGSDLNGDTVANERPAFATDLSRPSVVFTKFGTFDTDPQPGQKIVPRNYLTTTPMWTFNFRVSKTFRFHPEGQGPGRYALSFNVDGDNVLNHVNRGGFVGNLASPLFGQSTAIYLFRDTSNNRRIQFGTQFTF